MTKQELTQRCDRAVAETRSALQAVYDNLNPGQQLQIIKVSAVRILFDRYGVEYRK